MVLHASMHVVSSVIWLPCEQIALPFAPKTNVPLSTSKYHYIKLENILMIRDSVILYSFRVSLVFRIPEYTFSFADLLS